MHATADAVTWPSVRDVTRELDVTHAWVLRLIARGELRGVNTRLGWLVDPTSVREYAAARTARKATA